MKITTMGVDLAKNVFQLHGVDAQGHVVVRRALKRKEMLLYFSNLPTCLIGMEACGSAHYWARKLLSYGHNVKLMAPQFVKPYVKSNKNDARDAEAICEAVSRPNMRFVALKNTDQQAMLSLHRARAGFVKARTAQGNQIRGLLGEFGMVMTQGIAHINKQIPAIVEDAANDLPDTLRALLRRLVDNLQEMDRHVKEIDREIAQWHQQHAPSRKLAALRGVGPITASAVVATVGDARHFDNGRAFSAFLGLVPRQQSSGGKSVLLGISKRGDVYLRTLLIHGARSVVQHVKGKTDKTSLWLQALIARSNINVAVVALANKNARIIWAMLAKDRLFDEDYVSAPTAA